MPPEAGPRWRRWEPLPGPPQLSSARGEPLVVLGRRQLAAQLHDLRARLGEVDAFLDGGALLAVLPDASGHALSGKCLAHGFGGPRRRRSAEDGKLLLDRGQLRLGVAAHLHLPGAGPLDPEMAVLTVACVARQL